jgi:hypothetical protein
MYNMYNAAVSPGKRINWKVEGLYRFRGRKAEGVGQSETRNRGKGSGPVGSLEANCREGGCVWSRE